MYSPAALACGPRDVDLFLAHPVGGQDGGEVALQALGREAPQVGGEGGGRQPHQFLADGCLVLCHRDRGVRLVENLPQRWSWW